MARKYQKEPGKRAVAAALGATAIYARVSTVRQAEEGFSLDDQRNRLSLYCQAQGWNLSPDHVYVDGGESGTTLDRKEFNRMIAAARSGQVRRIVAMKLDRIARNVRSFLAIVDELQTLGCDLVLLKESFDTSTPHGRFALTMFAAMAELEIATITERMMSGKRQKASEGGFCGGYAPACYDRIDGRFEVNARAEVIRCIFRDFNAGLSLNAIARKLNAEGAPTGGGGSSWFASGIRHILTNGSFAGMTQWDGVEADGGVYPAIIDRAAYDAAQVRLGALSRGRRVDRLGNGELNAQIEQ